MKHFDEDVPKHRKKSKKNPPKKSKHKHEYELIEIKQWKINNWFTHKYVCKICGKENDKLRIK